MKNKQLSLSLEKIAAYHSERAAYWHIAAGQSWGREETFLGRQRNNERIHKAWASKLKRAANILAASKRSK